MPTTQAEIYDPLVAGRLVRVVSVEVLETPVLRVRFDDGAERDIDFSDAISRLRWFRTLAVPTTFESVEVVNHGRALQWITGADYCADALRILGDQQLAARMT